MDSPLTLDQMFEAAVATVEAFPTGFRGAARAVNLQVTDWPAPDMLAELDMTDPLELTGLYDGIPLTEKSLMDPAPYPDMIWLFRRPILAELEDRGMVTLEELVTHVTIHGLAHRFGWGDADIAQIDCWWE